MIYECFANGTYNILHPNGANQTVTFIELQRILCNEYGTAPNPAVGVNFDLLVTALILSAAVLLVIFHKKNWI